ncbi:Uncharacterised protein [Mycobacteroides abscessus subsp. abscessus]|nr:Uncharacterised protein [Mycobacteroides abscessus subsp. abscessus]
MSPLPGVAGYRALRLTVSTSAITSATIPVRWPPTGPVSPLRWECPTII